MAFVSRVLISVKAKTGKRKTDLEGFKRMTCPHGIHESDLTNYFMKVREKCGHSADLDLHTKVIEFVRGQSGWILNDCQLVVLGEFTAVYFLSGNGRNRFCIQQDDQQKAGTQVRVENLLLGFFRLPVALAALLEGFRAVLSLVAFSARSEFNVSMDADGGLVNFCAIVGDLVKLVVALLVAMDTVTVTPSLFLPPYHHFHLQHGQHSDSQNGDNRNSDSAFKFVSRHYGLGVWNPGHQRWLYRALGDLILASPGAFLPLAPSLEIVHLPPHYLGWLLERSSEISRLTLTIAAVLSVGCHLVVLCSTSFFKSPWASVQGPSRPQGALSPTRGCSGDSGHRAERADNSVVNIETVSRTEHSTVTVTKRRQTFEISTTAYESENISFLGTKTKAETEGGKQKGEEEAGGGRKSRCIDCTGCISSLRAAPLQRCSFPLFFTTVTAGLLFVTSLTLFVWHVIRMVQSLSAMPDDVTGMSRADWVLSCKAPVLLTLVTCVSYGVLCVQSVSTNCCCCRSIHPLPPLAWLVLHVADISTLWSRDLMTWLEGQAWISGRVGTTIFALSLTLLLVPVVLMVLWHLCPLSTCSFPTRAQLSTQLSTLMNALSSTFCLSRIQKVCFILAILMGVCGAVLAVCALPLPMAFVQTRFVKDLRQSLDSMVTLQAKLNKYLDTLDEFEHIFLCGSNDVASIKDDIHDKKVKALALTVSEMKAYCNDMGLWRSVRENDRFCQRYGASKLYFLGNMSFTPSVHHSNIVNYKSKKEEERESYLDNLLTKQRAEVVRNMDIDDVKLPSNMSEVAESCKIALQAVCVAKTVASHLVPIPFVGTGAFVVFLLTETVEFVLNLAIKIARLLPMVTQFQIVINYVHAVLIGYEQDRTLQFSINNFNLIYLAYPAVLTGCVCVLSGFWYRRGTFQSRRLSATFSLILPLFIFNGLAFFIVDNWIRVVRIMVEKVPMMQLTVTPLVSLRLLTLAYGLAIASSVVMVMLAVVTYFRERPQPKKTNAEAASKHTRRRAETCEDHEDDSQDSKPSTQRDHQPKGKKAEHNKIKVMREVESQNAVWTLAWLFTIGSCALVTVIFWEPVFAFQFRLKTDVSDLIERTNQRAFGVERFQEVMAKEGVNLCNLGSFVGKKLLQSFVKEVIDAQDPLRKFQVAFKRVADELKVDIVSPSLAFLQTPIVAAVYISAFFVTWAMLASCVGKPRWGPSRRFCRRVANGLGWLTLGWITSGVLFLTTVARSGIIPVFHVEVMSSSGLGYALAACVGLILASRELRMSGISPLL